MTLHLALQRMLLPSAQVSSLTTGSITLPSARGQYYASDYVSIASFTATSGTNVVSFTSIPQSYSMLEVRVLATNTASATDIVLKLNTDASNNYSRHHWRTDGSTVTQYNASATYGPVICQVPSSTNYVGVGVAQIIDPTDTTRYKVIRAFYGNDVNGSGQIRYESGVWLGSPAVTSIEVVMDTYDYTTGTVIALYGVLK